MPRVSSIQDGELLAERKVLECQVRAEPQVGRNQGEQSQNRQHHGREVSDPEVRKVNRFKAAGQGEGQDAMPSCTGPASVPQLTFMA